ncbi:hypothetical protein QE152_g38356 [Popillia japonica]|uniref:Uncharacterized protein n=1 Tax=Popillia japonica TaxID=7064 RepID=A0AAW1HYH7_POPJA
MEFQSYHKKPKLSEIQRPRGKRSYSPSQLLMSRICKTKVPILSDLLSPELCSNVQEKLKLRQHINKTYFDKSARDLKPLESKTNVTTYNHLNKQWEAGKIIGQHPSPRSYMIKDGSGKILRRNRIDIRQSLNECQNNCKNLYLPSDSGSSDNVDNDHVTPVELPNDSGSSDNVDNDHVTPVEHSTESTNECQNNCKNLYLPSDSGSSDNVDNDHVTPVEHSTESTNKCATNVSNNSEQCIRTRSGRLVKKPDRLNL